MTARVFQVDDWPIKKKLRLSAYAYAATVLLLILLWVLTVNVKGKIAEDLAEMSKAEVFFQQLRIELMEWKDALEKTVILDVPFRRELDPRKCSFGILFYSYQPSVGEIEPLLKDVEDLHFKSHQLTQEIVGSKSRLNVLHTYSSMLAPNLKNFNGRLEELMRMLGEEQQKSLTRMKELDMVFYAAIALFLILSIILFFFQSRLSESISEPLEFLTSATAKIAQGDLKVKLDVGPRRDEIGRLEASFKNMVDNMDKMNARLLQSEKMSAVGQLAAGVAHEINNPMGVILGFAQGISNRLEAGDPLEFPVKSIEREAVRCKSLVQDLLSFSRANDNSNGLPFDLNNAIKDAMRIVEAKAKLNSINIKMDLAPDIPRIWGAPAQVQQMVVNLADNALDAMPDGGTMQISTEILGHKSKAWVCLKVHDSGPGIPKEIQSKIFEPFFTTKPVGKGTGLGLSMVFEVMQRHSGTIEMRSQPGSTEFCAKFPIRED